MDQILPLAIAVLAANLLTAMFVYGMVQASKIYEARDLKSGTAACILIPLAFVVVGILAYY